MASGLEEIDGAFDVDALVKRGLFQAGANPGASSEVDDLVELYRTEQPIERGTIGDVSREELKGFSEGLDVSKVLALNFWVVKRVEIIESPDGVSGMEQAFTNM